MGEQGIQGLKGEEGSAADIGVTIGIIAIAAVFLLVSYIIINLLAPGGVFRNRNDRGRPGANLKDETYDYIEIDEMDERNKNDVLVSNDIRLRF